MFSKFLEIDKEKQQRIINAAMREFAQKGYSGASTNEIVKEAGISKGLLFHYFKNKKQLFLFLYDYCMERSKEEMYQKINFQEGDFLVRIRQSMKMKMEILKHYPEMFTFLEVAYVESSHDVKQDIKERNEKLAADSMVDVLSNIDYSKFKEDIDVEKAMKTIIWTLEKLGDEEIKKAAGHVDYEKVFQEADSYVHMFKQMFYK